MPDFNFFNFMANAANVMHKNFCLGHRDTLQFFLTSYTSCFKCLII